MLINVSKVAFALTVGLLAATPAMAGGSIKDAPLPATSNWAGFYVGVDAGYQFSEGTFAVPGTVSTGVDPEGTSLGGHIGFRQQAPGNIVVGAELRFFATLDSEKSERLFPFANFGKLETEWGGDARVSIGYAMGRFLPYVAGGIAFTDVQGCTTVGGPTACPVPTANFSDTLFGWTIGGGAAYALTDHFIARVDYTFSDFGSETFSTPALPGGRTSVDLETHAVRGSLSYKF